MTNPRCDSFQKTKKKENNNSNNGNSKRFFI